MTAMPSPTSHDSPSSALDAGLDPDLDAVLANEQRIAGRTRPAFLSLLIAFGIGIAASGLWNAYAGPLREAVAGMSPGLAWLAPPQGADGTEPAADSPADPAAGPADSADAAVDLRQNVDRIAASQEQIMRSIDQLSAGQDQLTKEIAKLQAVDQTILSRNAEPPAAARAPAARRPAGALTPAGSAPAPAPAPPPQPR